VKFLPLVWRNLLRRPLRTLFTALSVFVAFVLFGVLAAVRSAFTLGVEIAGADRLVTIHKVSLVQPLPIRYLERIRAVDGVAEVTHATWFGGIYREPSNFFAQMAVDPESWLRMYPEFVVPADQRQAWIADQAGALVGRGLAERFGWRIGTTVPLSGTIFRHPDGNTWRFVVRGIYDAGKPGTDTTQFFFHRKYLEESIRGTPMAAFTGLVGWYVIRVSDPDRAADIAEGIDAEFANSEFETKTTTEKAFVQAFAAQIGDIGAITIAITAAVFFTILLVAGNTMAQAIRERTNELAVLKTLGFSNGLVLALVLAESIALAGVAGAAGLAAGWLLVSAGDPTGGMLPGFILPPRDLAAGAGLVLLLGLAAGLLPAVQAMRLRIADALRRA
jgi:putative ABC transport system permease protein